MKDETGRVELTDGFVADFIPHSIALRSDIVEVEEVNKDGESVIRERYQEHGFFRNMSSLLNRLGEKLTRRKLKKFQSLKEYNEIIKEVRDILKDLKDRLDI